MRHLISKKHDKKKKGRSTEMIPHLPTLRSLTLTLRPSSTPNSIPEVRFAHPNAFGTSQPHKTLHNRPKCVVRAAIA
jgi:hypothetical protein